MMMINSVFINGLTSNTPFGRGLNPFIKALMKGESSIKHSKFLYDAIDNRNLTDILPKKSYLKQLQEAKTSEISDEVFETIKSELESDLQKLQNENYLHPNFSIRKVERFLKDKLSISGLDCLVQLFSESESFHKTLEKRKDIPIFVGTSSGTSTGMSEVFDISNRRRANDISRTQPEFTGLFASSAFGLTGENIAITNACASSLVALDHAFRNISSGVYNNVITLGVGEGVDVSSYLSFLNMGALSKKGISRPYDIDRDGFIFGEGAASMYLSNEKTKDSVGEILGTFSNSDGLGDTSLVDVDKKSEGLISCIEKALDYASLNSESIDYICAHGTSTHNNDEQDVRVYQHFFGKSHKKPSMFSLKGYFGHTTGASGLLELVATIGSYRNGFIPYTFGTVNPGIKGENEKGETIIVNDYSDINLILRENKKVDLCNDKDYNIILKTSAGFGGHNSVTLVKVFNS